MSKSQPKTAFFKSYKEVQCLKVSLETRRAIDGLIRATLIEQREEKHIFSGIGKTCGVRKLATTNVVLKFP